MFFGDQTLKVWDVETGEARRTLQGHSSGVQCGGADSGRAARGVGLRATRR